MKRKLIDDYYNPQKKKFIDKFKICDSCKKRIYFKLIDHHSCSSSEPKSASPPITTSKYFQNPNKDIIDTIIKTCQKSIFTSLHLEYIGKSKGKHKWIYSFDSQDFTFKSKTHNLTTHKFDPRSIKLSFTTNHKGSPLYFYDCVQLPGFSIGVLKSVLQKSIRRQNRKNSIKTSIQFACNFG